MSLNIDIDSIVTDLNGKADRDLTNVVGAMSASAKSNFARIGMPSDKYVSLTLGTSGATYTAPANGYFCCLISIAAGSINFYNKTVPYGEVGFMASMNAGIYKGYVPARKGDVVCLQYVAPSSQTYTNLHFIYAEGEVE